MSKAIRLPGPELLDGFKNVWSQPFAANSAVIALNVYALLEFAGLDVFQSDVALFSPLHELSTDLFLAVSDTNFLRLTMPFDVLI